MASIELVDVAMRDGNQSLWGATGLGTAHCLQIAPVLDRVGFRAADFTSSTHMGVAVRVFREDPWERIRLMHAAMPHTPLQFITTGFVSSPGRPRIRSSCSWCTGGWWPTVSAALRSSSRCMTLRRCSNLHA